jgi:hypothetical protein
VIFDDETDYDSFEIDLMQTFTESMLKTIFEIISLNSLTLITEIESNENEYNESRNKSFIKQANKSDQSKIVQINQDKEVEYLSSLNSSDFSTSSTSDKDTLDQSTSSLVKTKKMIDLNIDTINILSEKVKRRRTQRQTYLIALSQISDDQISSYHATFFAFVSASFFYSTNQISSLNIQNNVNIKQRLYKDSLLLKSKYYR